MSEWWKGACIYQIYPRSFLDSNHDGIGDLKGIIQKLDYIAKLGVDAVWISPFFTSPMKDFGYDVSNYRDIDPIFGTLQDFKTLLDKAHSLDIKIIIDLVLSHTSDQHPWFHEKPDYYVWANAKDDGSAPNNWISVFGGSAWEWHDGRQQYYLHNFLKEQPDLNFHNPEVQREVLDIARFWLDLGVDGFRLDVVNFYFHDPKLRDNPPRDKALGAATQFEGEDPYSTQNHVYDKSQPENLEFLEKFRALIDEYPGTFTLGESGDDHPYKLAQQYCKKNKRLHTMYNPHLCGGNTKALTSGLIREPIERFLNEAPDAYPTWAFSNHDVVRAASRWLPESDGFSYHTDFSKMLIALLGCLYGSIIMYQGEEFGLPEAKLQFEELQDPWGQHLWPQWQGRDGCRTMIPWDKNTQDGWLPMAHKNVDLHFGSQDTDSASPLNFSRHFLNWRKKQPALKYGKIIFQETGNDQVLHFQRELKEEKIDCLFNFSKQEQSVNGHTLGAFGFYISEFTPL